MCLSPLALANKQLLHNIRISICYLLITSRWLLSWLGPETVTNTQAVSGWGKSKVLRIPPIAPYLCWWECKHRHLTQLEKIDTAVSQAHYCSVEQISSVLWIWASCIISRHQAVTLNYKAMIMDIRMAPCNSKLIIFPRRHGFSKYNYIWPFVKEYGCSLVFLHFMTLFSSCSYSSLSCQDDRKTVWADKASWFMLPDGSPGSHLKECEVSIEWATMTLSLHCPWNWSVSLF